MGPGMKTILIADDKASGRDLFKTVLEGCGYRIVEAADGREALQQARECHPDLIILDLHMPDIDGYGVLRVLRGEAAFADLPIVALTASAMPEDRERVLSVGFTDFLSKPIRLSALRSEVARLLGAG